MKLLEKDKTALEKFKDELTSKYPDRIEKIILYGSHARGDAGQDSDIDVMVVVKDKRPRLIDNYGLERVLSWKDYPVEGTASNLSNDLFYKYWSHISPQIVDQKQFGNKWSPFFNSVRKEGVVLWKRD